MTNTTKQNQQVTPFKELSKAEQEARLAKYEAERAKRGTVQTLARVAKPVKIKETADGAKLAVVRLAVNEKGEKEAKFDNFNKYIPADRTAMLDFYASLEVGQLVSVEYKVNGNYNNIWQLRDRSK